MNTEELSSTTEIKTSKKRIKDKIEIFYNSTVEHG